jgi:hypothetical protein
VTLEDTVYKLIFVAGLVFPQEIFLICAVVILIGGVEIVILVV